MNRQDLDRIVAYVDSAIQSTGCHCLEVEWEASAKILRVYIDSPSGVGIDDCVAVNRCLEESGPIDEMIEGVYNLEVSSPGVERPLRLKAHFVDVVGKSIEVKLTEPVSNRRHGTGRVISVSDEEEVTLDTSRGVWVFPVSKVFKASLKFDWQETKQS